MRHEEHGDPLALPDAQQLEPHRLAREFVERAEGLVHQQQPGTVRQRPRQRHALLHPAGQLARVVAREALDADAGEQRSHPARAAGVAFVARDLEREPHVALHGAPGQQPRLLRDEPERTRAARLPRRPAEHVNRAVRGVEQAGDDPQQRRLPTPARADERDEFALGDPQIDIRERDQWSAVGDVTMREVAQLDGERARGRGRNGIRSLGQAHRRPRMHRLRRSPIAAFIVWCVGWAATRQRRGSDAAAARQ